MAHNSPALPTPPSQFLPHLSNHQLTETRRLLQPFLSYESWLRTAFADGNVEVDKLANMVPIYDGEQNGFKIRTIDRVRADGAKYIMPLPDHVREEDSTLAIAASFEEYTRNFHGFSHGILQGIDWSNIVVVGSSALLPLLSRRRGVPDSSPEEYFQKIASKSDIDIFLYGLESEDAAIILVSQLESMVRMNQGSNHGEGLSRRSKNAITFLSPKQPYRHVQVVLRLYRSISEILTGIDLDCSCVAFDGRQVYSNPRGISAIATRTNMIDLSRRGPAYEYRLWKYRKYNFEVFWDSLDRSRINPILFNPFLTVFDRVQGLGRLLLYEKELQEGISKEGKEGDDWEKQLLSRIDESGGSSSQVRGDYDPYGILSGEEVTAGTVYENLESHPDESCQHGTIQEVIEGKSSGVGNHEYLIGRVRFNQHTSGRPQITETLEPLVQGNW
ncbi:ankyrin repeat protein [Xylaria arbuscula]|nr:ankyrin repeat protein [Xylaria arbuscula]